LAQIEVAGAEFAQRVVVVTGELHVFPPSCSRAMTLTDCLTVTTSRCEEIYQSGRERFAEKWACATDARTNHVEVSRFLWSAQDLGGLYLLRAARACAAARLRVRLCVTCETSHSAAHK
jgi:hypothetical protein